jgi:mono/diheme cytochrome c family protein
MPCALGNRKSRRSVVSVLLSGLAVLTPSVAVAQADTVSLEAYEGWRQYSVHCARCHAQDVLNSGVAPWLVMSVKPDGPVPTMEEFMRVIREGKKSGGMPAFDPDYLEDARVEAIWAYVKGRSDGVIHPGRPVRRPD